MGIEKPEISQAKKEEIVKVLNDQTFEEVAYGEKHVIVMFHADNCDICKKVKNKTCFSYNFLWFFAGLFKFVDIFEKTAESMTESKKEVVFARVDLKKDDILDFKIEENPTFLLFPKGRKEEVIKFNGGLEVNSLIEFMEKNRGENKEKGEL